MVKLDGLDARKPHKKGVPNGEGCCALAYGGCDDGHCELRRQVQRILENFKFLVNLLHTTPRLNIIRGSCKCLEDKWYILLN